MWATTHMSWISRVPTLRDTSRASRTASGLKRWNYWTKSASAGPMAIKPGECHNVQQKVSGCFCSGRGKFQLNLQLAHTLDPHARPQRRRTEPNNDGYIGPWAPDF